MSGGLNQVRKLDKKEILNTVESYDAHHGAPGEILLGRRERTATELLTTMEKAELVVVRKREFEKASQLIQAINEVTQSKPLRRY